MKKLITILFVFVFVQMSFGQFSGTYNIGTGQTYTTLKSACDAMNAGTIAGDCTFYITSDLTEPSNVTLGIDPGTFTITFKPAPGISPTVTYTQAADNAGTSGAWVLGQSSNASGAPLVTTNNIIIDGSNTVGGITRDLKFISSSGTNAYPFRIRGSLNNITIKNCEMTAGLSTIAYAIWINPVNASSVNYIPNSIVIDNCSVTVTAASAGAGIYLAATGTLVGTQSNDVFKNNLIVARHRGIFLNSVNSATIFGNELQINQTSSGMASGAIMGNLNNTGTQQVYNNKITQLKTANTAGGGNGIRGIQASGGGAWNIYNNFITGLETPSTGTTEAVGIRVGVSSNIYFNTIIINNLSTTGPGTTPIAGIATYTASCDVKNNIIITNEDDFTTYCIYGAPIPNSSNHNNLYRSGTVNAKIGYNLTPLAALSDWQLSTSLDADSKSVDVTFMGLTDLHLSGTSNGDVNLIGDNTLGILTDIDGDTRNVTFPYMGADEASVSLPVELTSFVSTVNGKSVNLAWKTETEINNTGFDIERTSNNSTWEKIAFVKGTGNSNTQNQYSFNDNNLQTGKYQYRLKMIDNNGSFKYSKTIEAEIMSPAEFILSQNYPNPFNPVTTINYLLPIDSKVMLVVYSITGEKVAELVNKMQTAGQYNVQFNANGLASGTYIYRLQAGAFMQTKKMIILK